MVLYISYFSLVWQELRNERGKTLHNFSPESIVIINYILRMYTHTGFVRSAVVVCCRSYSALLGNLQITYRYLWHVYMIINNRQCIDSCKSTSTHVFFVCLQVELKFSYLLLASCLWLFPWLNRVRFLSERGYLIGHVGAGRRENPSRDQPNGK